MMSEGKVERKLTIRPIVEERRSTSISAENSHVIYISNKSTEKPRMLFMNTLPPLLVKNQSRILFYFFLVLKWDY
jgi:hypothetical protein